MVLLKLLTVVSLVVLQASLDALPVNALALEHGHLGRALGHADIAKKRDSSKQCKPRPTTSSSLVAPAPSSSSHPANTPAASQPSPTSTPSSSGSKILMALSNNEEASIKNFITKQTDQLYNWDIERIPSSILGPSTEAFDQLEFIPTIAGREQIGKISSVLTAGYAKKVFTFNEPELSSQANIAPQEAYDLWMQYIQPLQKLGYELIAPANTASPVGFAWITEFAKLCGTGCGYTHHNIHIYDTSVSVFTAAVKQFEALGLPLFITEIGCQNYSNSGPNCDQATMDVFFPGVMNEVMSNPNIVKVAWFGLFTAQEIPNGVADCNVMITCPSNGDNSDCTLNALGNQFLNY